MNTNNLKLVTVSIGTAVISCYVTYKIYSHAIAKLIDDLCDIEPELEEKFTKALNSYNSKRK